MVLIGHLDDWLAVCAAPQIVNGAVSLDYREV
jgi:hypothetical protein